MTTTAIQPVDTTAVLSEFTGGSSTDASEPRASAHHPDIGKTQLLYL